MARDRSTSSYRALLIPDDRCSLGFYSASLSVLTPAGPAPGDPVPARRTRMSLESGGEMDAGDSFEVTITRGGMPGPQRAGYLFATGAEDPLGSDEPTVVTGVEPVAWTTTEVYSDPHIIATRAGTLLAACDRSTTVDGVVVFRRAAGASSWASGVAILDGAMTWTSGPTLVELPDGRILLFRWVELAGNLAQVRMYYSDNDGVSWTEGQRSCLREPVSTDATTGYQLGRLRAAYADGEILLIGETRWRAGYAMTNYDDQLHQWASSDLGCRFDLVEVESVIGGEGATGRFVDIAVVDDVFVVAHVSPTAPSSGTITVRRIGSAFDPLTGGALSPLTIADFWDAGLWGAGYYLEEGGLAIWADDVGTVFLVTQAYSGGARLGWLHVARSVDGGVTWEPMGQSSDGFSKLFAEGDDPYVPWGWSVTAHRGRAVMVHGICPDASSTYEGSLAVAELGGFSSITMPEYGGIPLDTSRASWELTYLMGWVEPNGTAWSKTTSGAGAGAATSDGWWRLTTGVGDSIYYSDTFVAGDEGVDCEVEWRVGSGAGVVGLRHETGGNRYEIEVRVGTGSIVLYDVVAGGNVATVVTTVAQTAAAVRVSLAGASVKAWYRATGAHPSARRWVEVGASTTLTAGATAGSSRVRVGAAASAQADFRRIGASWDEWAGTSIAEGQSTSERWPRSVPVDFGYMDGGVLLRASSGPGMPGDSYTIEPRYEHGVEHAHIQTTPSPRRTLRTEADGLEQTIVWEWNSDTTALEPFRSTSAFVALLNANFRTAYLEGRNNVGTWVAIGTVDCAKGMSSLACIRYGRQLVVDTGTTQEAAHYFPPHILAGSHVLMAGTDVRPIAQNTAGAWRDGETVRPIITLDDYDNTEPALGDLEIWSKDALTIIHDTSRYSAVRLRIPSQSTHEGYYQAKVVVGHVFVFGRQNSWGRIRGWEPGTEIFDQRAGLRSSRRARPSRRYVQLPWSELVPAASALGNGAEPDPDFVRAAVGGDPVAGRGDTLHALAGLVEELAGADRVIGYLEHLPQAATPSTDFQLADRSRFFFGRITSTDVQINLEYGDEGVSEVNTSPGLLLQEEL